MKSGAQVSSSARWERPLTISVEENIGSGKSTFPSFCESDNCFDVVYEPIEKWTNLRGVNLLVWHTHSYKAINGFEKIVCLLGKLLQRTVEVWHGIPDAGKFIATGAVSKGITKID